LDCFLDVFLGAGSSSESELPELEELSCFFAGAFLAGLASDSLPEDDEDDSFLAGFEAAAFFATGLASLESELSLLEEESFLAGAFEGAALALATTFTDSSEESESEELSAGFFFWGTFWFSLVFFALLLLAADALEAALALLAGGLASLLSLSLSELELSAFFLICFFESFSAAFWLLFLSTLTFLLGGSDELEEELELLLDSWTFLAF
jgi:hypothetical protein